MKNKIWFNLCIILMILLTGIIIILVWSYISPINVKKTNLQEYVDNKEKYDYFYKNLGYVPDAKTAKIIGSRIIDNITGNSPFRISVVNIEYDEVNQLWRVIKWYLFKTGGIVIIDRNSGEIITGLLQK